MDVNFIQLRSSKQQIFELDYGGDVNFGGLSVSNFGLPNSVTLPSGQAVQLFGTTGLQSYGLGFRRRTFRGLDSQMSRLTTMRLRFLRRIAGA